MLDALNIPAENIHRLQGEDDDQKGSKIAIEELKKIVPANEAGVPVIDIVFLGMGEDAHVASLFPEENEEARNLPNFFRPVTATKPPPQRITIGYNVIAAAKEVWVLASGVAKSEAFEKFVRRRFTHSPRPCIALTNFNKNLHRHRVSYAGLALRAGRRARRGN